MHHSTQPAWRRFACGLPFCLLLVAGCDAVGGSPSVGAEDYLRIQAVESSPNIANASS